MTKPLFTERATLTARPGAVSPRPADPDADADADADPSIRITRAAADEIRRQADKRASEPAVRVGIRGGGCTGFAYVIDWLDDGARATDRVFSGDHSVRVHVDPRSFELLQGTELDFTRSIMGHGFTFNNPNAKSTCGCGESVQF